MDSFNLLGTNKSNLSNRNDKTDTFSDLSELEYCYDDLNLKSDQIPNDFFVNNWKATSPNNSSNDASNYTGLYVDLKDESTADYKSKMDLETDILELFDNESFSLYDPFQIEPELAFLELSQNNFIETSTPTKNLDSIEQKFNLNDFVCINDKKYGYVKFEGKVHFADGYFCGIELLEQEGKHNGEIDNIRYFKCKPNHGLFAPIDKVKLSNDNNRSASTNTLSSNSSANFVKIKKIKLTDSNPIPYSLNNTFQPIVQDFSFEFETKSDNASIKSVTKSTKRYKKQDTKLNPIENKSKMITNKLIQKPFGNNTNIKQTVSSTQSLNQQTISQPKNSLLNKISQQFKQKFISHSSKSEDTIEKRKSVETYQSSSNPEKDQSKKSKLKAPLSFKQTNQANNTTCTQQQQQQQNISFSSIPNIPKSQLIESKLPEPRVSNTNSTLLKSHVAINKVSNIDEIVNENSELKRNGIRYSDLAHTTSSSSTDSSSQLSTTNMKSEDILSLSSNLISSTSSMSSNTSPSRNKIQAKRLSGVKIPENRSSLSRTSAIPGVNRTTSIPSNPNQHKLLKMSSLQSSSNGINNSNHASKSVDVNNFSSSTPKLMEQTKNEHVTNLNKQTTATSSLTKNVSTFQSRLSHPIKLGFNQANSSNSISCTSKPVQTTTTTQNESIGLKQSKLALSFKRSSIPSQTVISTTNQIDKTSTDLSNKTTNTTNASSVAKLIKNQMNRTFDIDEESEKNDSSNTENKLKTNMLDEKQKRNGLLIFDNDSTNNLGAMTDDFLENELIPDDLLDEIHNFMEPSPHSNSQNKNWFTSTLFTSSFNSNSLCKKLKLDSNVKTSKTNLNDSKPIESSKNNLTSNNRSNESSPTDFISNDIQNEVKFVVENLIRNVCQLNEMTMNSSTLSLTSVGKSQTVINSNIILDDIKNIKSIENTDNKNIQSDNNNNNIESEMEVVIVEEKSNSANNNEQNENMHEKYLTDKLDNEQNLMIIESDLYTKFQDTTEFMNDDYDDKLISSMNKTFDKLEFSTNSFHIQSNSTSNHLDLIDNNNNSTPRDQETNMMKKSSNLIIQDKSKIQTKLTTSNTQNVSTPPPIKRIINNNTIALAKNSIQKKLESKYNTTNTSSVAAVAPSTKQTESLNQLKELSKKQGEQTNNLTSTTSVPKTQFIKKSASSANQKLVKKLKSLPSTNDNNKIEDDINSVFDTDNHTSSCSDNEDSKASSKASSRANSLKLTNSLRKKTLQKEVNSTKPGVSSNQTTTDTPKSKAKTQLAASTKKSSFDSSKNNNKENSMPKSLALNKIYKSRDGITAVSSNTSIMSEVSNISKSSLPSSNPTSNALRNVSISSTSSVKLINQNQANINRHNSLSIQKTEPPKTQTISNRLVSASSKQLQNISSLSRSQASFNQNQPQDFRKLSIQNDAKTNALKKPGLINSNQNVDSKIHNSLSINTNSVRAESTISLASPVSSVSSSKVKMEAKFGKEVKRLEALCEVRTKELSILKIRHKEVMASFDAVTVAFNYLANDLNGFEVTKLRTRLNLDKKKYETQMKSITTRIDDKEKEVIFLRDEIERLIKDSNETKVKLEKQLMEVEEDYKTQIKFIKFENELEIKSLKQESDTKITRLNKTIDTMKNEHEKLVYELREEISKKTSENIDLDARLKECEEALSKDKDERIARLLDIQHNLEKEIESLKAALDIKNLDLFDLRTKNNQLVTQCDNYNELNMKLRRYKQEVEELKAILKNKQEAERRASEHNRLLSMKIEKKDKENQRLSMQNEQLQFRLQSQPNLNQLNNESMNDNESNEHEDAPFEHLPKAKITRSSTIGHSYIKTSDSQAEREISQSSLTSIPNETQLPTVKLRSKSFKSSTSNNSRNNKMYSSYHQNQFRPVSENFDFSINERDMFMTRSVVMYDCNNDFNDLNDVTATGDLTAEWVSSNDGCDSTSSSNSNLEKTSETDNLLNSIPCIAESNELIDLDKMSLCEVQNF